MGVKYYTHFLMSEAQEASPGEFSGVVELNRVPHAPNDMQEIATILARSLDIELDDIRILHWSRLH
jgi:hypothetical protein